MSIPFSQVPVDDHVFLLGRPPIAEFLGFMRATGVADPSVDTAALTAEWREARAHVESLEATEAGYADKPLMTPLPPELTPLVEELRKDRAFQATCGLVPTQLAMVELDRIVVVQKYINLAYIATLRQSVPAEPDQRTWGEFAFGLSRPRSPAQFAQSAPNAFSFVSPSRDLRFLDSYLLEPDKIVTPPATGYPVAYVCIAVGFGSNQLQLVEINGRLILHNGSHRAYCLRDLGVTHAPCLIQKISNRDEFELVASPEIKQNQEHYLRSRRPPVLKDYFDPKLRKIAPVRRKNRMLRVQIGVEQSDVPPAA